MRATRDLVLERDGYRCQRCGTRSGAFSVHHRRPRGMGGSRLAGTNRPANLVTVCGSGVTGCHGWIESHRLEARSQGWLVPQAADPARVPVETIHGRVWLTDDGQRWPVTGPQPF